MLTISVLTTIIFLMDLNSDQEKPIEDDFDIPTNADNENNSSEWLGALVSYFYYLGRRSFNTFYKPKRAKKNIRIGWLIKLTFLLIVLFCGYLMSN